MIIVENVDQPHREEWEEDLTSTQNLALSRSKQATFVEPTVKLGAFIAHEAPSKSKTLTPNKGGVAKFSNMVQNRRTEQAVSEDQYSESRAEDDYEDDFESVSKSQLGMSMGKPANPKKVEESYSNEAFESFGESKTLSGEDKGVTKHRRPGKFTSPIKETDDEKHSSMNEVSEEQDDSYSSASSAKPKNSKGSKIQQLANAWQSSKQQQQLANAVQSSQMSSDLSVSNPAAAAFSKQVQEFMKGGGDSESESGLAGRVQRASALLEESESSPSKSGGSSVQKTRGEDVDKNIENINALYERYKMFKKLAAKYGGGDGGSGDVDEESSATISKSQ